MADSTTNIVTANTDAPDGYQLTKEQSWRYSDSYAPNQGQPDRHFPAIDKLDYENYLVVLNE